MDWKKIISLPGNIYKTMKEDAENSILLAFAIAVSVVCSTFNYPLIGFALSASVLVAKSILELFRTSETNKAFKALLDQIYELFDKLESANKELTELKMKFKNKKKGTKTVGVEENVVQ